MEKIYTIPVNEAFDYCGEEDTKGCPFCEMYKRLEENELEIILGASMMEPDIRIKTKATRKEWLCCWRCVGTRTHEVRSRIPLKNKYCLFGNPIFCE